MNTSFTTILPQHPTSIFTHIIHLADIHIPNNVSRHEEYATVFQNLHTSISNLPDLKPESTLIVIAGDIFHDARKDGKLSPNAILLFKTFLNTLTVHGTIIIIPGNHDNNITYQSSHVDLKKDTLSCVLAGMKDVGRSVWYLPLTGVYNFRNVVIYHTSVFDIDKLTNPNQYPQRLEYLQKRRSEPTTSKHIGLLHCGIDSQQLQSGYVLRDCAYKVSDLQQYDITCLGDTHHHQFLGPNKRIGYPNSLIQQNHGESLDNHGFILWDLTTLEGRMVPIVNPYGFVTISYTPSIDLSTLSLPSKSRVRLTLDSSDTTPLEDIHRQLSELTVLIEVKEKRNWTANDEIAEIADNDSLTDHAKMVEYIKLKHPNNEAYQQKIIDKLSQDLKYTDTLDSGRCSCSILRLIITNFQCYKGTHTIDFTKYPKHSTISISGNNAAGKSTLIRALSNGIWGADKGMTASLINNQSTQNAIIIEFEQNSIHYRLTRCMTSKGKQTLKLEKLMNGAWSNESLKHIKKTQKKIEAFFGSKEDAKQTWLAEQGSSNTFINSKDNYLTFQHFTGTDKFDPIFQKAETFKRGLERQLKDLQKQLPSTTSVVENSTNETLMQNSLAAEKMQKNAVHEKLQVLQDQLQKEVSKQAYGSASDLDTWTHVLESHTVQIQKLHNILKKNPDSESIWSHEELTTEKRFVQQQKETILIQLPASIIEQKGKGTLETNVSILQSKLDSIQEVLQQHPHAIETEPDSIRVELEQQKNFQITLSKLQKQQLQTEHDIQALQKSTVEPEVYQKWLTNVDTIAKQIVIKQNQLKDFSPSNDYKNDLQTILESTAENAGRLELELKVKTVEKEQVACELSTLLQECSEAMENSNQTAVDTNEESVPDTLVRGESRKRPLENSAHTNTANPLKSRKMEHSVSTIIVPSKLPDFSRIIKGYTAYTKACEDQRLLQIEVEHAAEKMQAAKREKNKYKALVFEETCPCCTKNKNHFQIDAAMEKFSSEQKKYQTKKRRLKASQKKCAVTQKFVELNQKVERIQKLFRQVQLMDVSLNNIRLEFEKAQQTESQTRCDLENYVQNIQLHKSLEKDMSQHSELEHKINSADVVLQKIATLEQTLQSLCASAKELQDQMYSSKKLSTVEKKYDTIVKVHSLIQKQSEIEENIRAVNLLQKIADYNQRLQTLQDFASTLSTLRQVKSDQDGVKSKIENYHLHGGYNATVVQAIQVRIKDLHIELDGCTAEIARLEYQLQEYYNLQETFRDVQKKVDQIQTKLQFASDYCSVVDPRSGFPNQLIKSKLEQYTKNVNAFVKSAGFHFLTTIEAPTYKADSKKQSQKLLIQHEKDGRLFSELSGAEKFIFNIGIQITLGDLLSTTTPPLQCIDEGFSSLDTEHLMEIPQILNTIKTRFNLILFISHNELIKHKADFLIRVKQENKLSMFDAQ